MFSVMNKLCDWIERVGVSHDATGSAFWRYQIPDKGVNSIWDPGAGDTVMEGVFKRSIHTFFELSSDSRNNIPFCHVSDRSAMSLKAVSIPIL